MMGLHHPRTTLVKITAVALWALSLSLITYGTTIAPHANVETLSWSLWLQMCAWGFTAWWIHDSLHRRDRVRVSELAEIMARVAVEEHPRHAKLTRVH